uniref:CCHC-type domain-containing protein n=1 Tax=Tanacetum cinerariifolium TaxID=118510 RepID=A0A6L2LUM3_TANCI|nr:hypothetical protein [Tanacetum cinerariifolium]
MRHLILVALAVLLCGVGDNVIEKGSGNYSVRLQSTRGGGVYTGVIGPDGLNTVSGYCFCCCENGHEASDCVSDVAHGGGGCDPTADHSSRYRCGGNQRARECPIGNNCGSGGSGCYNCGEGDHYARDCSAGNSRRGGRCYTYGEVGHFS